MTMSVNLAREKRGTKYEHPTRKKCNLYIYTVINKSPCDHANIEREKGEEVHIGNQRGKLSRTSGDRIIFLGVLEKIFTILDSPIVAHPPNANSKIIETDCNDECRPSS